MSVLTPIPFWLANERPDRWIRVVDGKPGSAHTLNCLLPKKVVGVGLYKRHACENLIAIDDDFS